MAKKKVNPRNRPATQADVDRILQKVEKEYAKLCWALVFTVMHDKYGWGAMRLSRLWEQINTLAEEVAEKRVSMPDLIRTLREEAHIDVTKGV